MKNAAASNFFLAAYRLGFNCNVVLDIERKEDLIFYSQNEREWKL